MRKSFLFFLLLTLSFATFSENWIEIGSPTAAPAKIVLVSSTLDRTVVHFSLEGFTMREVQTPRGAAFSIHVENSTPVLEAGAPDLPKVTASLVIPDQAGMNIRVISSSFIDYHDIMVAPSKGVIMRDTDPSTIPYHFGEAYGQDTYYPGALSDSREPYIIREVRGQTIIAYPFQYNPVAKTLRVYYDMTIELYTSGETGINPLTSSISNKKIHPDFLSVYQHQFMNLEATDYTPLGEYGNLLVICYGPFMNAMQPFVDWKRAEGYPTEIINKDSVGTTAAQIKAFIANYYNTKGLTHVLLVGDAPQIPTNTGGGLGGPSDNAYGYVVGNDHYADVFIGRFSAENEAQVQVQVQRTLEYEQTPQFLTDDWFTTVIGIGSDQGPGDDNEYDYKHIRNQQTQLLSYNYTWNPELFDGTQGGNDAPGNPTPTMVKTEVNNGASLILYTGHGSKTSWGTSGFSNTNVSQLTNAGKLPFIWSVACVNGEFMSGGPCFAEAWMRASQGGQPTGAIAFLGATINQSWDPPMEGQDQMTNILTESDSNDIKRTFAGLSMNGCMKMIDAYGSDGADMADTWTIFGDPTVMVRTAVPQAITAQYDTLLFISDSTLTVFCSVRGARVTATLANTILATGVVVNDTVTLTFPPLSLAYDTIHLAITGYNRLPYMADLLVHAIPDAIAAGFIGLPSLVAINDSVAFADTSMGNIISWHWSFPGGNPSYSLERNPVVAYDSAGTFDVELIVEDGFSSDTVLSTGYIVVSFPVLTGEMTAPFSCTIHPNPSNGKITLSVSSSHTDQLELSVFDMIGNRVYSENNVAVASQLRKTINLSALPEGVYFLKISGKQMMTTRKLIIKR